MYVNDRIGSWLKGGRKAIGLPLHRIVFTGSGHLVQLSVLNSSQTGVSGGSRARHGSDDHFPIVSLCSQLLVSVEVPPAYFT